LYFLKKKDYKTEEIVRKDVLSRKNIEKKKMIQELITKAKLEVSLIKQNEQFTTFAFCKI